MADFRHTLEVKKNSTCFLSYSYFVLVEDLADETPTDYEIENDATLDEVTSLIEGFCDTEDKTTLAMQYLLNTGTIKLINEY